MARYKFLLSFPHYYRLFKKIFKVYNYEDNNGKRNMFVIFN